MVLQAVKLWWKLIPHSRSFLKGHLQHHPSLLKRPIWVPLHKQASPKIEPMPRVLNVAEKNDAAKSIASVLSKGQNSKREGFSRFNKIYEFEYRLMNQQVKMSMTSVSGHLLGLEFCGIFKKWHSCNPVDLFSLPVEKYCSENYVDIKRTLEREIRGCQTLIIWTDCDREGENIGYEIIDVCKAVKPSIRVYRATFSEITPQAIARAINGLGPPDQRVSEAVDVRQELDLRIGAAFTRFQTLRLQRIFPQALNDQLISYGSCQFPTLGFVVERYKQVQDFIAEPFWKIKVSHNHEGINADFNWKRVRLFNQLACQVLYDQCVENPIAEVTDVRSKNKSKWRPVALDTVELEKLASRKLKINAKEAMQIAEKLYTKGYISYPRTETNMFPKELDMNGLVQEQTGSNEWGAFAQGVLDRGPNPRNGTKTDQAHPPIHPLKFTSGLEGNEWKLYEFIVRHFLACVSSDAQGHETTVDINLGGEMFSTSGLMIIARNYLDVYPYEKWNAKEIPVYVMGNTFEPDNIEMVDGETSPPPLLTEADLIALMDKHGIGTDATHADHIETVKARMYIGVQGDGRFVPGQLGMGLVEGYDSMGFEMSKPHLRAELEADLKLISDGRKAKDDVLQYQIAKYKDVFIKATQQAKKLDEALSPYLGQAQAIPDDQVTMNQATSSVVMNCPKCDKPMILRTTKDGKKFYVGCSGYPDCKTSHWFPEYVLDVKSTEDSCQICNPRQVMKLRFKFKAGRVPPSIPNDFVGCIGGCDEMLNETLGIRSTARGSQANSSFIPRSEVTPVSVPRSSSSQSNHNRSNSSNSGGNSGNVNNNSTRIGSTGSQGSGRNSTNSGNVNNSNNNSNRIGTGIQGSGSSRGSINNNNPNRSNNSNSFHSWTSSSSSNSSSVSSRSTPPSSNTPSFIAGGTQRNQNHRIQSPSSSSHNNDSGFNSGRSASFNMSGSSTNGSSIISSINKRNCGLAQTNISSFFGSQSSASSSSTFSSGNNWNNSGSGSSSSNSHDRKGGGFNSVSNGYGNGGNQNQNQDSGFNRMTVTNFNSNPRNAVGGSLNNQRDASKESGGDGEGSDQAIVCNCGKDAILLTVRKEGPNTGRQFYKCFGQGGGSCDFFLWADDNDKSNESGTFSFPSSSSSSFPRNDRGPAGGSRSSFPSNQSRPAFGSNNAFDDSASEEQVMCNCGLPAKSLTVSKNGPNIGRPFHGCSKPREQSCNFFKWGDENMAPTSSQGWQDRSQMGSKKRPPPTANSNQPKKRNPPTCSLCGMPGHKRPKCPENQG